MDYLNMLALLGIGGAHPGGILLTKAVFENEKFPLELNILDAGCGTGQTTSFLYQLGYDVTGLDSDPLMIQHAKKRNLDMNIDIPYMNENLSNTTVPNETFDIILCESVLNFTSLQQTLPEISRMLKSNGRIIAIEMVRNEQLSQEELTELTTFYGCEHIFSISEWQEQFAQRGLTIYKTLAQEDLLIENINEPTTEFSPIESIPESAFILLSNHEGITMKYHNKLSYRVFFARKTLKQ
jgi:2-polyprenyl-3-methyl-5-hydroxy-6-metoxy-1,4-benzoquinol methylase